MINLNLKIGDKVVVSGRMPPAQVIDIIYDPTTDRTVITILWGNNEKSTVYAHDENSVWYKFTGSN
jgi:hypothetical protein